MSVPAGPSWQTCTTSARQTEWASGEWRKLKTSRIWSRTESPTYRYLQTHLLLCQLAIHCLSHSYTHRSDIHTHKGVVNIFTGVSITRGKAHMRSSRHLSHLLVSFAPSITVRISFYKEQVRNVIADCFSSWICQAGFLLLVTNLVRTCKRHRRTCWLAEWQTGARAAMQKAASRGKDRQKHNCTQT